MEPLVSGGGTLKFHGASAVNENRVLAVKGGPTKGYLGCKGGVGTGEAQQALSAPPPPPIPPPPHHCCAMAHTVQYTNKSQQEDSNIAKIILLNKHRMQYKNHAVRQVLSLKPKRSVH